MTDKYQADKNDKSGEVTALIEKAAEAHDSQDALRFSQAATNAANAMCALANYKLMLQ